MKKLVLNIMLCSLMTGSVFSQSAKQQIKYAKKLVKQGNHYGASIYFKSALYLDSSNFDLIYSYAQSLRNYNNYNEAENYYKKIIVKDRAGRIYKDANFWLASMQKFNAKYKESLKSWKKVKSIYKNEKKSYQYLKAKKEINSCIFALRNQNDSSDVLIKNYGSTVNTTDSEFSGKLFDNTLEFSSLRADSINDELEVFEPHYRVGIYSTKFNEDWQKPQQIDTSTVNNNNYHNANGTYSPNRDLYIFSRCDSINGCSLFYSKIINGRKTKPIKLPQKINENGSNTTHPHITTVNEKLILFFSSNRKGGLGNMDIWYAEIFDGPTFGKAKHTGSKINSPDAEISPFFNSSSSELYFSSTWHNGFGGFDVFKSQFIDNVFKNPENLLPPINSSYNDLYFFIDSKNEQKAIISSNRMGIIYKKGPTCCNDLWEVTLNKNINNKVVAINSLDDLNKYLPVTLYFHNDRPGPKSLDTVVTTNYLESYYSYLKLLEIYREEYSEGLKGEKKIQAQLDIDDFFKHYVDKGISDLQLFTNLLLKELEKGQKIEVTIKGFASPLAKSNYNVNLTKRRISSLINFLRAFDKGQFNRYIDGGFLIFNSIPFGEYTSKSSVSDDYYDQRNSIYNRSAALERRIEIQSIRKANYNFDNYAELSVDASTFDFGKLIKGELAKHTFMLKNTGNKRLEILQIENSCGCTTSKFEKLVIEPGQTSSLDVEINTNDLIGKQVKSVTIISDAFPTTKRLVLTAEIFND